jgi:hypothetical protein
MLRLAVAGLGRPMAAFDLAFTRYWEKNYPGTRLGDYLRQASFLRRGLDSKVLLEQMKSVLADVAQALASPGIVGSLVGQGVQLVVACTAVTPSAGAGVGGVPQAGGSGGG